jgi:hypothetical protein
LIRVTIEMIPGGHEQNKRHMATIEIHNDLTDTMATGGRRGSYRARLSRISQFGRTPDETGWYDREVRIAGVNRKQSGAVYRILYRVLDEFLR